MSALGPIPAAVLAPPFPAAGPGKPASSRERLPANPDSPDPAAAPTRIRERTPGTVTK